MKEPKAVSGKAKKGGEIGVNGARYKGGQFLPGSKRTVKGDKGGAGQHRGMTTHRTGLIEPGKTGVVQPGEVAIFSVVRAFVGVNNGVMEITASDHSLKCHGYSRESLQILVTKYNNNERFIDIGTRE